MTLARRASEGPPSLARRANGSQPLPADRRCFVTKRTCSDRQRTAVDAAKAEALRPSAFLDQDENVHVAVAVEVHPTPRHQAAEGAIDQHSARGRVYQGQDTPIALFDEARRDSSALVGHPVDPICPCKTGNLARRTV